MIISYWRLQPNLSGSIYDQPYPYVYLENISRVAKIMFGCYYLAIGWVGSTIVRYSSNGPALWFAIIQHYGATMWGYVGLHYGPTTMNLHSVMHQSLLLNCLLDIAIGIQWVPSTERQSDFNKATLGDFTLCTLHCKVHWNHLSSRFH